MPLLLLILGLAFTAWPPATCVAALERHSAGQAAQTPGKKTAEPLPQEIVRNGKVIGHRVSPRPGEICTLCYQPVEENDAAYVVQGQRVALHTAEIESDYSGQLLRLVAQLRPRGAFVGAGEDANLASGWFYFGLYVLTGLIFGALAAHRALHKGYNPAAWFAVGLALNLVGFLVLVSRPAREVIAPAGVPAGLRKISSTFEPQVCACGAENHPSAAQCSTCGAQLEPRVASEAQRVLTR
jgi:hypothetical protein